jgi:hypothetical protein
MIRAAPAWCGRAGGGATLLPDRAIALRPVVASSAIAAAAGRERFIWFAPVIVHRTGMRGGETLRWQRGFARLK